MFSFLTKFTAEQREELVRLREQNVQLLVQNQHQKTTADWLMVRINTLEKEREALTERLFQVAYPVPVIERANERPAPAVPGVYGRPIEDGYVIPEHLRGSMVAQPPMAPPAAKPKPAASAEDEVANSIQAMQAHGAAFEDMGDEEAARLGITHDGAFVVVRDRKSVV